MKAKDYAVILDSMQTTGVYVIREDNHQFLYYNKRVKEVAPNIQPGMICHELWAGSCFNCPLLTIGDKKESRTINYDDPFGKAVDIVATRILWEESIPAFIITVTPHAETASYTYHKIIKADLAADSFQIIKMGREEWTGSDLGNTSLSQCFTQFIEEGYVYCNDVERFQKFTRLEYLQEELKQGKKMLVCTYRRKSPQGYRWNTMEIVPDFSYSEDNQTVMVYVKDVHDVYRKGLELEEINIQNQEIIRSLGEQNFAVYVIELNTGVANPVRVTENGEEADAGIQEWDSLLLKMVNEFYHPECREKALQNYSLGALRESWKKGEKKELLCRRMMNGSYHYVLTTAYFHENSTNSHYVIVAMQDVDERTRQEIRRTQNDKRMAAVMKSRYSVMNTVNLDTGVCERVYLNDADDSGRVHRGDYEYFIQKAVDEIVYEEDIDIFKSDLSLESLRKKAEGVEDFLELICQYRIKGPSVIWVEEHVIFLRQDKAVLVNILGRDITKEKLKEAAAMKAKAERTNIIHSLSSLFFAAYYMDMESNTFRMVTQVDEVGEILGTEANCREGIRTYARHFVHPDDREEYLEKMDFQNLLDNLSEEHPVIAVEYRRIREEGDGFEENGWIRATAVLAETKNGKIRKALYVAQDVTEIKQKEEREHRILKDACDAANQANASKSEFLSRMSHDIRTPMNAIIGMTAIAGTHLDDRERVSDCLNKITVSSKHLLSLINEVLDMSKIESGKIDLEEEEFNLSDLIQNLLTIIRPSVQAKQHELELHIAKVEHEDVIGDSMRLQQVFVNILGNAVKYTPPGGRLEVEISEKPSKLYGYGCYVFVFRDNGIGMSEEYQKQIFEPFSRAEDSRVSKIEGTGLGMTIAMNIIHMMNGNISVESKLGEGSQFTVTVFLKQQNVTAPDMEQFVDLPVLVADDDMYACEAACMVLDEIGMKSQWVLSGREALKRVQEAHRTEEDFFAVILDWKMPDMDGIQTAREIRREVGPDIPIIILSAYDWSSVEAEARQAGVNGFISKPLFRSKVAYLFKQLAGNENTEEGLSEEAFTEQDFHGKRVLLAEDNELNREIAQEIIGSTGVIVESVVDGKQAVERFQETEPGYYDLIFMDIQMPVMNGYEAAKAIRKTDRADARKIPIIAMTANAFAEDVIASRKAGMNEHIAKPLNIEQLMKCMKHWFSKGNSK